MSEENPIAKMSDLALTQTRTRFSQRVPIRSILTRSDGGSSLSGQQITVGGWVKTGRQQGKSTFAFLKLNDGSCPDNLQVIVSDLSRIVHTGTSALVYGKLTTPPEKTKQKIELRVDEVLDIGLVDPVKYPLPKTKLTVERLRDVVHLRPRTNTLSVL